MNKPENTSPIVWEILLLVDRFCNINPVRIDVPERLFVAPLAAFGFSRRFRRFTPNERPCELMMDEAVLETMKMIRRRYSCSEVSIGDISTQPKNSFDQIIEMLDKLMVYRARHDVVLDSAILMCEPGMRLPLDVAARSSNLVESMVREEEHDILVADPASFAEFVSEYRDGKIEGLMDEFLQFFPFVLVYDGVSLQSREDMQRLFESRVAEEL